MREIFKASELQEAFSLKEKGAVYFAGGSEILRLGSSVDKDRSLIDVNSILSHEIKKEGGFLVIGAAVTFQEILECGFSPEWLKKAVHFMASQALRNQATIGGNIACMRDDSYLIPSLLASGASLTVYGPRGLASIPLEDYVRKGGCSCLILSVSIPSDVKVALKRFSRSASSHSALNIAASSRGVFACVKSSGIALSVDELEKLEYRDDITGSGEYKKYLALEEAGRLMKEVNA